MILMLSSTALACDKLPGARGKNGSRLRDVEFIDVYVKLARATSPEEKARVLKEAGTSREELDEFIEVRLEDLPALSTVFDSVVARMGSASEDQQLPVLPPR
jgi:hypothetical protein